jgi:hypothetical protein
MGFDTSWICSTSGDPYFELTIAFMRLDCGGQGSISDK